MPAFFNRHLQFFLSSTGSGVIRKLFLRLKNLNPLDSLWPAESHSIAFVAQSLNGPTIVAPLALEKGCDQPHLCSSMILNDDTGLSHGPNWTALSLATNDI
ncbi:hypothetical protein BLOT_004621 [Blomia tropicalis]|nr:hypothetical protein BLOT_004621 [Blomia tropicalis]